MRYSSSTAPVSARHTRTLSPAARSLLAEVEDTLAREFEAEDKLWAEAVKVAREVISATNAHIAEQCAKLGVPPHIRHPRWNWGGVRGHTTMPAPRGGPSYAVSPSPASRLS
jgi:hypothetical protein